MEGGATARDYGWCSLAVLMGVLTVLNLAACGVALVRGDLMGLVRVPVSLLFGYWIAVGAWRRTTWGRDTADAGSAAPVLGAAGTRRLVILVVACCIALTVALGVQVIAARG